MFLAAASVAMTLTSCGGSKGDSSAASQEEGVKIEAREASVPFLSSQPIEGNNADYFEIVDQNVTLTGTPEGDDGHKGTIRATVKIKVLKPFENLKGFAVFPPMTLYFLNGDKENMNHKRLEISKADQDVILAELKKYNPGVVELSYKGDFYDSGYNEIFDNVKFVQIRSAALSDGTKSSDTTSGTTESSSDDSSDNEENEWDKILNEYEEFVDSYISFYKKAMNGNDLGALAEYPKMLQKANALGDKLKKGKSAMTSAQWKRYQDIATKLANAASEAGSSASGRGNDMDSESNGDGEGY